MATRQLSTKRIVNLAADPVSGTTGELYYNTALGEYRFYNGVAWTSLVEAITGSTTEQLLSDSPPLSPNAGDIWFNTATGKTYFYYDSLWVEVGTSEGGRPLVLSGDVTGTGTDNIATTLGPSGVASGTYGASTAIPVLTIDVKGRITDATTAALNIDMFRTITDGTNTAIPTSPTDTFTMTGGSGVSVVVNPTTDTATISNTGVLSISGGTTGLTPSTATTGAVTLSGTLIPANGGTGLSSYTIGDILYASGTATLSKLAGVATGNALISGGTGTAPSWGKIGLTTHISGTLGVGNGGTGLATTPTNGQLLIGNGTNYTLSALTQGTGITVTNGSGSISIANSGVTALSGTANEIEVSASTGSVTVGLPNDVTIGNNLTVTGTLTVNGTTTTVNSTTMSVDDPIITLGGDTAPVADDNKDRGIEFRYYDTQARLGFFGYDDSTGYFTFLTAATNTSEVFSGTKGVIDVNGITQAADNNTTLLATTAFVIGQASSTNPVMNGSVAIGSSLRYARADHVHPTDTSRAPTASPTFTGTVTTPLTTAGYVTTTSGGVLGSVATIPNAGLTNSSITIGTTSIALGSSSTTLAGLTQITVAGGHLATAATAANQTATASLDYFSTNNAARIIAWGPAATNPNVEFWAGQGGAAATRYGYVNSSGLNITGSGTFSAGVSGTTGSFTGAVSATGGAQSITVGAGAQDHAYVGFNARTATPGTRTGYLGYPAAASNALSLVNEVSGGTVVINTNAGSITMNSGLSVTGYIRATAESYIDISGNQLLMHSGATSHPTVIHRNDASNYYILLSDAGTTPSGTWNALRPLTIALTTGLVTMTNGLTVNGGTLQGTNLALSSSNIYRTADTDVLNIWGGTSGLGANIELYGSTHAGQANNAFYDATTHTFRTAAGVTHTYINSTGINTTAADTATAASHYYVETASDGFIRPKTLANVRTEIVTTAAVNAAAATTVGTITSGVWNAGAVTSSGTISGVTGAFTGNVNMNSNTQARPSSGSGVTVNWNYSGGSAEVDFWNVYLTATSSFSFKQLTGTGVTHTDLFTISPAGAGTFTSTIAASGLAGSLLSATVGSTHGVASAGSSTIPARADHVHPTEIPTQTGNSGKFLTTNGTATSWGTVVGSTYQATAPTATTGALWTDSDWDVLYVYNGSSWHSPMGVEIFTPTFTTNNYTSILADRSRMLMCGNGATAGTVTISSGVAYPIGTQITVVWASGTGQISLVGSGVTINSTPGLKLRALYSSATLIKTAATTWLAIGDLAP